MNEINHVFTVLYNAYGPQYWWPVTHNDEIYPKYTGGPKTEKQQLEVMFGAILTQNTSWSNVEKAITNLNKKNLFDIEKIISIKECLLAEIIRPSGYFNQKAKKLKALCIFLNEHSIKYLEKKDVHVLREMFLSINGIGPETADSIILYAFNKPSFVIDAYTKRIFSRIGLCDNKISYHNLKEMFEENLDISFDNLFDIVKIYNEYHALIVEHAKQYCRKKPLCKECILNDVCRKRI